MQSIDLPRKKQKNTNLCPTISADFCIILWQSRLKQQQGAVMRQAFIFLILLLVLPLPGKAGAATAGLDFAVFFSNDLQGKTEPCG